MSHVHNYTQAGYDPYIPSFSSIPHPSPAHLLPLLVSHSKLQQDKAFADTSYACGICLTSRKGAYCLRLVCGHVFCKDCLAEMWGLHVREGGVDQVVCPEVGCKTGEGIREATEDELAVILSEEEVQRWLWLRKRRDLERGKCITFAFGEWCDKKMQSDPTALHCPMGYCQEPVPRAETSTEDGEESSWARLRTCHSCGYSFCSFCKRTWWVAKYILLARLCDSL